MGPLNQVGAATFYWNACTKPGMLVLMNRCVLGVSILFYRLLELFGTFLILFTK